jgi:hypothetical protein
MRVMWSSIDIHQNWSTCWKVNARTPKCQNIQELGTALVQGWQQYPQPRLRCLIHGIRRRFHELYRMRGSYTHYWLLSWVIMLKIDWILLPSVAGSLALCGLCGLALTSIRIGRLANGWPSKWGTTNERSQTGSVKECQRTERSLKMTPREDRLLKRLARQLPFSTTNTLRWNVVFLGLHTRTWPSTGFDKSDSLSRPDIPSHMVTCPLKPGCFMAYCQ